MAHQTELNKISYSTVARRLGDQHLPTARGGLHQDAPVDRHMVGIVAVAYMRVASDVLGSWSGLSCCQQTGQGDLEGASVP